MMQPRSDYALEAEQVLKSCAPAFEKQTEDGMTFRIYRMGSLEARTTQAHDGKESVGVIFSVRDRLDCSSEHAQLGPEKIQKVTEYVERAPSESQNNDFRYYVVLEA